jgi:tetratricopeptide (TPR) repeat protein
MNEMKKCMMSLFVVFVALSAQAQSLDEAKKLIDNELYYKAKVMLLKLAKDPAQDKNLVNYYLGNVYLKTEDKDSAKICYASLGEGNKSLYGHLAAGRLALLNGNEKAAKEFFEKATIASKLKNSEALYQIGDAWYKPEVINLKEAIYFFEEAYKIDVKNSTNMLTLGDAYLDNNEGGKAMSKYESAADVNNKLTMAFIKIGRLNVRARTYDDAIDAFKKAVALEPENAIARKELGEVYYLAKKYDLAKPELKKYIMLNKEDVDAKTKFIKFLLQIKEYDQVVAEATAMLQEDPNNLELLRSLAFSNLELKRFKDGYEYAKQFWIYAVSAKIRPIDYIYSARLAAASGDTAQAITYFKTVLANDKNNEELLSEYAKTLWQAKRYEEAIQQYNDKITQFGGTSLDYYYLGRANFSATKYMDADAAFKTFADKNPTSPDGYLWRAKCYSRVDPEMKTGDALSYYEKFIEIAQADPTKNKRNLIEAYSYMAAYYMNAKDNEKAKANLANAAALDPNDEFVVELQKLIK